MKEGSEMKLAFRGLFVVAATLGLCACESFPLDSADSSGSAGYVSSQENAQYRALANQWRVELNGDDDAFLEKLAASP